MKYEKEGKSFPKPKSTIMIEGHSEAGEVDKGKRRDSMTQKERDEKKKGGR